MAESTNPRLKDRYLNDVVPALQAKFNYANVMELPKIDKVVLNIGVGEATADTKKVKSAEAAMQAIAGQKPVVTRAKKSIAGFKVRENMPLGVKVTLRGAQMYEFIDRLVTIAMPRIRDFRGLNPKSFDGNGNFAMGIKEHFVFPEIDYDQVDETWGMDIIVATTATSDDEARFLLNAIGFPFPSEQDQAA